MADLRKAIVSTPLVSPYDKVSKVIATIAASPARGAIVFDAKQGVLGVIDDRILRDFSQDAATTNVATVMEKTAIMTPDSNAEDAISFFLNTHYRILPVTVRGKVVGSVTRSSILALLEGKKVVKGRKVSEFMMVPCPSVASNASIARALSKMREHNSYHVCLLGASGKYEGMVSSFDIATKVAAFARNKFHEGRLAPAQKVGFESEPIAAIADANAVIIAPGASLESAALSMAKNNVTALPVFDDERIVGMITSRGVLHCCLIGATSKVVVHGLRDDEKMFAASIGDQATAVLDKLERSMPVDLLSLHVKSSQEGDKRRYSVRARLMTGGKLLSAHTPDSSQHKANWDVHLATKEVLDEIGELAGERAREKVDKRRGKEHQRPEE